MKPIVTIEKVEGGWRRALDLARRTRGKKKLYKEPSSKWKTQMLIAEHSPIRAVEYIISFEGIRQWVTNYANICKYTLSMDELILFCKKVLNHYNHKQNAQLKDVEGSDTN